MFSGRQSNLRYPIRDYYCRHFAGSIDTPHSLPNVVETSPKCQLLRFLTSTLYVGEVGVAVSGTVAAVMPTTPQAKGAVDRAQRALPRIVWCRARIPTPASLG